VDQSQERIRLLIVDDIEETRENLRKLLSFDTDIEVVGSAGSGFEAVEKVRQLQPNIVLMDINMPGMDGITAVEKVLEVEPTTQVIMLSVQGETDYLRRAMTAGAWDFLTKPASGSELISTIRRVYDKGKDLRAARRAAGTAGPAVSDGERRRGEVVAVFGPKGGVGCTLIAVNLAIALQQLAGGKKIALMDADLQFGDVGVMLNLQASRSVADLVPRIEELDSDMLSSVLTAHGSGIKVLLAPPHPVAAEGLLTTMVPGDGSGSRSAPEAILNLMRRDFDIVVVDVWSWLEDVALTVFDAAALIVLVVMPNIPAIKNARLFLEVASKLDYPMEKIALVVNGVDRHQGIQVEQIEKAMIPVVAQIPLDERAALAATNRGVPFVVGDRDRPISQSIFHLAQFVQGQLAAMGEQDETEDTSAEKEPTGTGLLRLRGVFKRG
jgi:pilus assembly protein CpaE